MTNKNTIKAFAVQLDSLNLDRAGTIDKASAIIADLTEKLTTQEKRNDALDSLLVEALHLCDVMAKTSEFWDEEEPKAYARENAEKMLINDIRGTQKARLAIQAKWGEWHKQYRNRYKDNTDFAEAMLLEHKNTLQSVVTITQWCGKWSKEAIFEVLSDMQQPPLTNQEKKAFSASMKQRIKTLQPHHVIRWCDEFNNSSNRAS